MTVGDLANECGIKYSRAYPIVRAEIPAFRRVHKGAAFTLTAHDRERLRPLFLAARPAPSPAWP